MRNWVGEMHGVRWNGWRWSAAARLAYSVAGGSTATCKQVARMRAAQSGTAPHRPGFRGACHHYASAIALVVGRAFARPVGSSGPCSLFARPVLDNLDNTRHVLLRAPLKDAVLSTSRPVWLTHIGTPSSWPFSMARSTSFIRISMVAPKSNVRGRWRRGEDASSQNCDRFRC